MNTVIIAKPIFRKKLGHKGIQYDLEKKLKPDDTDGVYIIGTSDDGRGWFSL